MSTNQDNKIRITLLIENPSKNKNWGPLLRCCVAYGISTIYVIGYDQCDVRGSHGSSKHVQLISLGHSYNYKDAIQSLTSREEGNGNNGNFELIGLLSPLSTNQEDNDNERISTSSSSSSSSSTVIQETILHQQKQTEKEIEIVRIGSRNEIKTIEIDNNNKSSSPTMVLDKSSDPIYEFCQKLKHQHQQQNNKKNQIKNICLVVDKLKCGLPFSLGKYCNSFIHIPHNNKMYSGSSSSSMFTLEASVSIIFHELMSTGLCIGHTTTGTGGTDTTGSGTGADDQTTQTNQEGQKYYVERIHKGGNPDSPNNTIERQKIRQERERKYQEQQDEADLNSTINDDGDY